MASALAGPQQASALQCRSARLAGALISSSKRPESVAAPHRSAQWGSQAPCRRRALQPHAAISGVVAATARPGGSGAARVSFCVPDCRLAFGEHLRVVGGCPELGSWDANAAPMLAWSEGDCWVGAMTLPPGDLSFKLVVVRSDGGQRWEDGGDRLLQVSERSMLRATCRFGDTSNTALDGPAFSSVDDEYDLQPVQDAADRAARRVEELRRGVADLTRRKQKLADKLAGLERSMKGAPRGSVGGQSQRARAPMPDSAQLATGWLYRSQDDGDLPRRSSAARRQQQQQRDGGAPSLAPLLLVPALVPVCATALVLGARSGVPLPPYLQQPAAAIEALLPAGLLPGSATASKPAASVSNSGGFGRLPAAAPKAPAAAAAGPSSWAARFSLPSLPGAPASTPAKGFSLPSLPGAPAPAPAKGFSLPSLPGAPAPAPAKGFSLPSLPAAPAPAPAKDAGPSGWAALRPKLPSLPLPAAPAPAPAKDAGSSGWAALRPTLPAPAAPAKDASSGGWADIVAGWAGRK